VDVIARRGGAVGRLLVVFDERLAKEKEQRIVNMLIAQNIALFAISLARAKVQILTVRAAS
jgi:hypothetical protein